MTSKNIYNLVIICLILFFILMVMMTLVADKDILISLIALSGVWLTVTSSVKVFAKQKWWDKMADSYSDTINSLIYCDNCVDTYSTRQVENSKLTLSEMIKKYGEEHNPIAIRKEAQRLVLSNRFRIESGINGPSIYKSLSNYLDAYRDFFDTNKNGSIVLTGSEYHKLSVQFRELEEQFNHFMEVDLNVRKSLLARIIKAWKVNIEEYLLSLPYIKKLLKIK